MSEAMLDKPRILIVDDEPRALELLTRTLRKTARIESAESGEQALELLANQGFDLVISDQRMPGLSGVDLLSSIAESSESTGRILLTGYADLEATVAAINRGRVHAYLHKPCAPSDLLMVVENVLARVRLVRENARLVSVVCEQNAQLEERLEELRESRDRVVASERMAAVGQGIAMVVHDLRAPLAMIQAAGDEIQREVCQDKLEEITALGSQIQEEAARTLRMCEELLELTRMADGTGSAEQCSLDDEVSGTVERLRSEANEASVSLECRLESGARVSLDCERWSRMIENIVRNAFEALPEGGTVSIETARTDDRAVMTISDDGPGVSTELVDSLFEPFATAGKTAGTGLGLAIARKVATDHCGTLVLDRTVTNGACFRVEVPLASSE